MFFFASWPVNLKTAWPWDNWIMSHMQAGLVNRKFLTAMESLADSIKLWFDLNEISRSTSKKSHQTSKPYPTQNSWPASRLHVMNIDVYLPSGQCASVVLPPHATVSDLAEYWGRGLGGEFVWGQPGSWNLSKKQCRKNSITQMWWLKPFLNDNGKMERCGCMIVSVADDDCVVGIIPCLRRYT